MNIAVVHGVPTSLRGKASALALALALALPAGVQAQSADGVSEDESIIVTGSRIARTGIEAPTPVTMLGTEQLQNQAVSNIGEAIQRLPSVLATSSAQTTGVTIGDGGHNTINLRGLGATRTLVLVDGHRFVPSTTAGTVDTNLIPAALVERVEVVTGGASAAYGSDAVSGVVNIILNKKLQGLRLNVQTGISGQGDDKDFLASLAAGTSFADDRGHVVFGIEHANNRGVGNCYENPMPGREFCHQEYGRLPNPTPGVNGYPATILASPLRSGFLSSGGLINGGPLRGLAFNPDGELYPFEYGDMVGLHMMGGGEKYGNGFITAQELKSPVKRTVAMLHADYEFSDNVSGYVEGSFGQVNTLNRSAQTRDVSLQIHIDNPFLPADAVSRMIDAGVDTIPVGRFGTDMGYTMGDITVKTYRGSAGLKGDITSRLHWDAYYQYGRTDYEKLLQHDRINANFTRAVDAVIDPGTGNVVCRSTLSPDPAVQAAAAGCAPLNIIGANRFSAAGVAYAFGDGFQRTRLEQHVFAANLTGDLVDLWAGPLSFAAGAEHRRDSVNGTADPISDALGFYLSNGTSFSAPTVKVTEGYVEGLLPLLKDSPVGRYLELNGAVRYTDYSTSGGVTTWKVGAIYEPVAQLRIRGTRSRDIRAPNVNELFSPTTNNFASVRNPEVNVSALAKIISGGNLNLTPEVADTWTGGFAFQPDFGILDGLTFSVDYYSIKIKDAIGVLGSQTVVDRCFEGATEFCSLVFRDSTGAITEVHDLPQNINGFKTRGLDFELNYAFDTAKLGRWSFRGLATKVFELTTTDGAGSVNRAGQTGVPTGQTPGVPSWTLDGTVTLDAHPFSASFEGRYIAKGKFDPTLIGPDDPNYDPYSTKSISQNVVKSYFIANLSARVNIGPDDRYQVYGVIDNLFNRKPPLAPGAQGHTNAILFDQVLRTFRVGFRAAL